MDLMEFCKGIGLMEEAIYVIEANSVTEEEYLEKKSLYKQNREAFYHAVLNGENAEAYFLMYYCRFACDIYLVYEEKGIEPEVFWDTFADIRHWCLNCQNDFGKYGIHEYQWFWRHFGLNLFKLGRLQYESAEAAHFAPEGDDKGINIHIPQGEPLKWGACERSLNMAQEWFGKGRKYECHSWLLDPSLKELLEEDSNIIIFQNHFNIVHVDYEGHDAEYRIFGKVLQDVSQYPEETSLQKRARRFLQNGGRLGDGYGILK